MNSSIPLYEKYLDRVIQDIDNHKQVITVFMEDFTPQKKSKIYKEFNAMIPLSEELHNIQKKLEQKEKKILEKEPSVKRWKEALDKNSTATNWSIDKWLTISSLNDKALEYIRTYKLWQKHIKLRLEENKDVALEELLKVVEKRVSKI